jgi:putative spermidine/putrescine transport system permease protein
MTQGPGFGMRAPGALESLSSGSGQAGSIEGGKAEDLDVLDVLHEETPRLPAAPAAIEASGKRRGFGAPWAWLIFLIGLSYFVIPLIATFQVSMKAIPTFSAYANAVSDPRFVSSLGYSFIIGIITVVFSIGLIVPTAYWVRLRTPRLRPIVEFITLLPFVVPPVVLVFALIRTYKGPPLPLTNTDLGSSALLVFAYVVLSLPYMYRAVDAGMRAIDIRSLTEAAQSMGASWFTILLRIILPNLRVALLSGAFLSLAIVIGEYTIASYLVRPAFGPYLSNLGSNRAYEPAAVTLISFGITWLAMIAISLVGRGSRSKITIGGAR